MGSIMYAEVVLVQSRVDCLAAGAYTSSSRHHSLTLGESEHVGGGIPIGIARNPRPPRPHGEGLPAFRRD